MAILLGIDVGGTGIKGGLVDTDKGVMLTKRFKYPTPEENNAEIILDRIHKIANDAGWKGKKVGCGFPAIIKDGTCYSASNIDNSFLGFNIEKYFNKNSDFKFKVINDADAAGIAEITFGAGKDQKGTVVNLTLGTGIGSSIFRDRKLVPNSEFGHIFYNGAVAEKYTSNKTREELDLSWEDWGRRLNGYLNHIEFILSPDLIILGGGVSKKYEFFSKYLKLRRSKLARAILKNEAGTIGAAIAYDLRF